MEPQGFHAVGGRAVARLLSLIFLPGGVGTADAKRLPLPANARAPEARLDQAPLVSAGQHDRAGVTALAAIARRWADGFSTCLVSDNVPEAGVLDPGLGRIAGPETFAGLAVVVHAPAADNLAVWEAIARAPAESVLVIATEGNRSSAIMGGNVARSIRVAGIVAVVTDSLIRDIDEVSGSLTVVAAGVTPRAPTAKVALPQTGCVTIAGTQVCEGDLVVGDNNGVAVLPARAVAHFIERLDNLLAAERRQAARFDDPAQCRRFLDERAFRPR